ncbi:15571_t:CDS:2, partial [Gigaspora rosea]
SEILEHFDSYESPENLEEFEDSENSKGIKNPEVLNTLKVTAKPLPPTRSPLTNNNSNVAPTRTNIN